MTQETPSLPPGAWACVMGYPIAHSLSPALHNAAFQALGLDGRYELREVEPTPEAVAAAVKALRASACLGANVTAPHKQAVMPHLDELQSEARMLRAVNTIVHRADRLVGDNTDARGLARWMEEAEIAALVPGADTLILGAGGAARATAMALSRLGAKTVNVVNRTQSRAEELADDLRPHLAAELRVVPQARAKQLGPMAVVVNATSLGHHGQSPELSPGWFTAGTAAVELAYNPPVSPFMELAQGFGARTENGLGMLVHQAILGFEQWTGVTPPADVYWRAGEAELARRAAGITAVAS